MRQIIFRGRRVDNGEFVYGYYIRYEHMGTVKHIIVTNWAQVYVNSFEVDPSTIGQFTGLRDSKRTAEFPEEQEVFEGDLVKDKHNQMFAIRCNIHWGAFCLAKPNGKFLGGKIYYSSHSPIFDGLEDCKVIGNIHENPELLVGENN